MDISETVQKVLQEEVVPDLGKIKAQIVLLLLCLYELHGRKKWKTY